MSVPGAARTVHKTVLDSDVMVLVDPSPSVPGVSQSQGLFAACPG